MTDDLISRARAGDGDGDDPVRRGLPRLSAGAGRPHRDRHAPRRRFELTRGGRFTLLSFADGAPVEAPSGLRTLRVVGQPAGPGDIADREGQLAAAYDSTGRTLVLIRPDGHIALISDAGDPSVVSDYLRPGRLLGRCERRGS